MALKASLLCPPRRQVAFPNDGVALYGAYNGSLGEDGVRLRLRLFYSGGELACLGFASVYPNGTCNTDPLSCPPERAAPHLGSRAAAQKEHAFVAGRAAVGSAAHAAERAWAAAFPCRTCRHDAGWREGLPARRLCQPLLHPGQQQRGRGGCCRAGRNALCIPHFGPAWHLPAAVPNLPVRPCWPAMAGRARQVHCPPCNRPASCTLCWLLPPPLLRRCAWRRPARSMLWRMGWSWWLAWPTQGTSRWAGRGQKQGGSCWPLLLGPRPLVSLRSARSAPPDQFVSAASLLVWG